MRSREVEVKLKVPDLTALRKRLRELGFRQIHRRCFEDNTLLDTPDRALRKERKLLRLRRYGNEWLVTFKGTPDRDPNYKSRLELETHVESPAAIRAIFDALGYVPVFQYQKYRSQYVPLEKPRNSHAHCEIAVDETPIGIFLELEGDRRWIDRVARDLGFDRSQYSTLSYGALYLEDCRRKKIPPADMVFPDAIRRPSSRQKGKRSKKMVSRRRSIAIPQ